MTDLHLTIVALLRLVVQQNLMYRSQTFTHENIIKAKTFYIRFTLGRYEKKKKNGSVAFLKSLSIYVHLL